MRNVGQESSEHGPTQLSSIPGQSVSTPPACTGLPDVRSPARLSSRNPLAQARNRNLTSSGPQDWGPDPTNHSTHLGPSFLSLSRTTPLPPRLESPETPVSFSQLPRKTASDTHPGPDLSEIHSPNHSDASPTHILRKSACHTCPLPSWATSRVVFQHRTTVLA